MRNLLFVILGGGLGSGLRFGVSLIIKKHYTSSFPLATFAVNLIGSLLIGIIIGLFSKSNTGNDSLKLLLATGFCGGFTTFSSFASENIDLIQSNQIGLAILYIGGSIILGLLAVWTGIALTKI
jgi:fluoride exporter